MHPYTNNSYLQCYDIDMLRPILCLISSLGRHDNLELSFTVLEGYRINPYKDQGNKNIKGSVSLTNPGFFSAYWDYEASLTKVSLTNKSWQTQPLIKRKREWELRWSPEWSHRQFSACITLLQLFSTSQQPAHATGLKHPSTRKLKAVYVEKAKDLRCSFWAFPQDCCAGFWAACQIIVYEFTHSKKKKVLWQTVYCMLYQSWCIRKEGNCTKFNDIVYKNPNIISIILQ